MSADDVARALMRMDDRDLRARVAAGDPEALAEFELTDEEADLLVGAAVGSGDAEVEGFGSPTTFAPPYVPVGPGLGVMRAVRYADSSVQDPNLQQDFREWTATRAAEGTW
jgi:hypothetical protein